MTRDPRRTMRPILAGGVPSERSADSHHANATTGPLLRRLREARRPRARRGQALPGRTGRRTDQAGVVRAGDPRPLRRPTAGDGSGRRRARRPAGRGAAQPDRQRAVLRLRHGVGRAGGRTGRPLRVGDQPERNRLAVGPGHRGHRTDRRRVARRGDRVLGVHRHAHQRRVTGEPDGSGHGPRGQGAGQRQRRLRGRRLRLVRDPHVDRQGRLSPRAGPGQPPSTAGRPRLPAVARQPPQRRRRRPRRRPEADGRRRLRRHDRDRRRGPAARDRGRRAGGGPVGPRRRRVRRPGRDGRA